MNSESPAPRRVTETPPVFPCWLWRSNFNAWQHEPDDRWCGQLAKGGTFFTHWLPDQPAAPTCVPDNPPHPFDAIHGRPPSSPQAALGVREALIQAMRDCGMRGLYQHKIDHICTALAPLLAAPVPAGGETKCADCGCALNAGEAAAFTACDKCWDKKHPATTPTPPNSSPAATEGGKRLLGPETINEMADLFLRWKLPFTVCADRCAIEQQPGRVGTNLLSFVEAREMILAVVGPYLSERQHHLEVENSGLAFELEKANERVRVLEVYRDICNVQIKDDEKQFDADAAMIAALRQELSAARGDKELLDWLDHNCPNYSVGRTMNAPESPDPMPFAFKYGLGSRAKTIPFRGSVRGAIAAALKGHHAIELPDHMKNLPFADVCPHSVPIGYYCGKCAAMQSPAKGEQ